MFIFKLYQSKTKAQIWLYEKTDTRFEGKIMGFDEYMNLVLDECEEVNKKLDKRTYLGRILLKGDNISLITSLE